MRCLFVEAIDDVSVVVIRIATDNDKPPAAVAMTNACAQPQLGLGIELALDRDDREVLRHRHHSQQAAQAERLDSTTQVPSLNLHHSITRQDQDTCWDPTT